IARPRWRVFVTRCRRPFPDKLESKSLHPFGPGWEHFRFAALPASAVASRRPGEVASQRAGPGSDHLQDDLHRVSPAHPDDRRRRVLGESHMGFLLELGSQGNLGCDHLAGLRRLLTHASDPRMERPPRRVFRDPRFRGRDVYLLRRYLPAPRTTCLCLKMKSKPRSKRKVPAKLVRRPSAPRVALPTASCIT